MSPWYDIECAVWHATWRSLLETSITACVRLTLTLRSGENFQRDPKPQAKPIVLQTDICLPEAVSLEARLQNLIFGREPLVAQPKMGREAEAALAAFSFLDEHILS